MPTHAWKPGPQGSLASACSSKIPFPMSLASCGETNSHVTTHNLVGANRLITNFFPQHVIVRSSSSLTGKDPTAVWCESCLKRPLAHPLLIRGQHIHNLGQPSPPCLLLLRIANGHRNLFLVRIGKRLPLIARRFTSSHGFLECRGNLYHSRSFVSFQNHRNHIPGLHTRSFPDGSVDDHAMTARHGRQRRTKRKSVDRAPHRHPSLCPKNFLDTEGRTQRRNGAALHPIQSHLECKLLHNDSTTTTHLFKTGTLLLNSKGAVLAVPRLAADGYTGPNRRSTKYSAPTGTRSDSRRMVFDGIEARPGKRAARSPRL